MRIPWRMPVSVLPVGGAARLARQMRDGGREDLKGPWRVWYTFLLIVQHSSLWY